MSIAIGAQLGPHIAALYGMEDAGTGSAVVRFLVMELVEGETLAERLPHGPLLPRDAVRIATQIAEAVEAAHEKSVIHRDLKPANVKITPDEKVKVLDFGLAKLAGPPEGGHYDRGVRLQPDLTASPTLSVMATQAGVILGTAAYMSPEQAKGAGVDHRSDLFSFGSVLYEMLTGRPPFRGDTAAEILASVLIRDPDFTALPPKLNPRVVDLLRRCFDKNPKRRWQAAGDLHAELEIVAASAETAAADAGAIRVDSVSRRRERFAWLAAGAAALAAIALGVPAFVHLREAPSPEAPADHNPRPRRYHAGLHQRSRAACVVARWPARRLWSANRRRTSAAMGAIARWPDGTTAGRHRGRDVSLLVAR